jgi:hypothetical protein
MKPDATTRTHDAAVTLCQGSFNGTSGWRLPTAGGAAPATDGEITALYNAIGGSGSTVLSSQGWTIGYYWGSDLVSGTTYRRASIGTGTHSQQAATSLNYVVCVR